MSSPPKTLKQRFYNRATSAAALVKKGAISLKTGATTAYSYMPSIRGAQTQQLLVTPPTPDLTDWVTNTDNSEFIAISIPTQEEYRENLNLIYKLFPSTPRFYINTGGTNEIKINFDHNDNNYFFIINNKDDGFKEILKLCEMSNATTRTIIEKLNTIIRHLEQHNTILLSSNSENISNSNRIRRSRTLLNKSQSIVQVAYRNRMLNKIKNKLKNIIKKHNSLNRNAPQVPIVDTTLLNDISIRHITVVN